MSELTKVFHLIQMKAIQSRLETNFIAVSICVCECVRERENE